MALPDYVKRAKNNYNSKHELIQLRLPPGSKERIKAIIGDDGSMAAFCIDAILETIDGYEAAERYVDDEPQETTPERPEELQEVPSEELPKNPTEVKERLPERHDPAVKIADLQAIVDRKRQEQEERKEKMEQEKKTRQKTEREEKHAEMRAYVEKMRDGAKDSREREEVVQTVLADQGMLSAVLSPYGKDAFISKYDQETYDDIVKADKERIREETKQRDRTREPEPDQNTGPDFTDGLE